MHEVEARFWPKVERSDDGCWRWIGATDAYGYGYIQSKRVGQVPRVKNWKAHRVSWEIAHERLVPVGMFVLHHCDNPPCVNPAHLYVGTKRDNARDRARRGRGRESRQFGEANPKAKLTDADVLAIRSAYDDGATQDALAAQYGVAQPHISRIVRRINR